MSILTIGRRWQSWLALGLVAGGCVAAESDGDEQGMAVPNPRGTAPVDAATPPATGTPTARTATAEACGAAPAVAALACVGPDVFEPNDVAAPVSLALSAGCTRLQTQLTRGEKDGFRIKPPKSDPVQVTLSYTGVGKSDLDLAVVSSVSGSTVASSSATRKELGETAVDVFAATAGADYDLSVTAGASVDSCQPYTVIVETAHCTDEYEDNDTVATATSLPLAEQAQVSVMATSHELDDDYYRLTASKADPILVTGSYAISDAAASIDVDVAILAVTGTTVASASASRKAGSESWELWVPVAKANSVFHAEVHASGSGCAPYTLTFDAAACTDPFEDNDDRAQAQPLPLGVDHAATALDDDFYDVSALPVGGRCTVRYTLANNSTLELSGQLRLQTDVAHASEDGEGTGTERSFVLDKRSSDVTTLVIESDSSTRCQPYTVRCE